MKFTFPYRFDIQSSCNLPQSHVFNLQPLFPISMRILLPHDTIFKIHITMNTRHHLTNPAHLRCHKVSRVARCHEQTIVCPQLFSKSKITDSEAIWWTWVVCVENVGRLQISMYNLNDKKNAFFSFYKFGSLK